MSSSQRLPTTTDGFAHRPSAAVNRELGDAVMGAAVNAEAPSAAGNGDGRLVYYDREGLPAAALRLQPV